MNAFAEKFGNSEFQHAPLFLYNHSNGTGVFAIFPSLNVLTSESGYLGRNRDAHKGSYLERPNAPSADSNGDKSTASWLVNAANAADWQGFYRTDEVRK